TSPIKLLVSGKLILAKMKKKKIVSSLWFHIINDIHLKPNLTYKERIFFGNAQEERRGHLFVFYSTLMYPSLHFSKACSTSYHLEQVMDFFNERKSHGNIFNEIRTIQNRFLDLF